MKIDLQIAHRGNEYVLKTHGLQVGYADDTAPLLDVQNIKLERGEIAALVGTQRRRQVDVHQNRDRPAPPVRRNSRKSAI